MPNGLIDYQTIRTCIARMWAEIYMDNEINLHDSNIYSENIIGKILDILFDWNLANGNINSKNQKGFDLIDRKNKKIVQVSSTFDRKKINHSLQMSDDPNNNCNGFDFIFVGLTFKKKKFKQTYVNRQTKTKEPCFINTNNVKFNKKDIYNLDDIVNKCFYLSPEKKSFLVEILTKEYGTLKSNKIFKPTYPTEVAIKKLFKDEKIQNYESVDLLSTDISNLIQRLSYLPMIDRQILFVFLLHAKQRSIMCGKYEISTNELYNFCNELFDISYEYLWNELNYLYEKRFVCIPDYIDMSILKGNEKIFEKLLSYTSEEKKEDYLRKLIIELDFSIIK